MEDTMTPDGLGPSGTADNDKLEAPSFRLVRI